MKNLAIQWHLLVIVLITPIYWARFGSGEGVGGGGGGEVSVKSIATEIEDRVPSTSLALLLRKDHDESPFTNTPLAATIRTKRSANDWLIAPNTRWCGRGNSANNTYNHLGGASAADRCCRKHDHCHASIPAMSNRYSLFNYRPYTLTHCSCDRRFRTCLKMAGDLHANTIGQMFFNVMRSQCFVLRRERLCRQRAADGSCSLYHVKQRAYVKDNKRY